ADRRAHQRRPRRAELDPAALRQPQLPARHPDRALPHRAGRPGDAAARRHEPGGQGIRGLAGPGEPRRAGAVAAGGRGAGAEGGAAGQPARPGRRRRRHRHRRDHAAGAAQGTLARDDGAPAQARHPRLAQGVPGGAGVDLTGWRQPRSASLDLRAGMPARVFPLPRRSSPMRRVPALLFVSLLPLAASAQQPAQPEGWTGTGALGLAMARGNSRSESLNTRLRFSREEERWKNGFALSALRSRAEVESDVDGDGVEERHYETSANRYDVSGSSAYRF